MQTALQWFGFYTSTIDGAFGRGTRASMAAWQEAQGLDPTGILTTAQRATLTTAWRDETRAFLGNDPANFALTWETLPAKLEKEQYVDLLPSVVIAEYRRLYPDYTPSEVFFAATTAGRSWRGAIIEAEERAKQGAPAWVYQLDWRSPAEGGRLRAFHTLDIPLVFDNIAAEGSKTGADARARAMAARMSAALIALARHGNPNHAGLPAWAPYTLPQRQTMVFDDESRMQDDPRGGERKLYAQVPFVQRGTF